MRLQDFSKFFMLLPNELQPMDYLSYLDVAPLGGTINPRFVTGLIMT